MITKLLDRLKIGKQKPRFIWAHEDSLRYVLLTIPVYWTKNQNKAEISRLDYIPHKNGYQLRILGILHGLFGLTMIVYKGDSREG